MPKRHEMPVSESLAANRPRRKASLGAAARVALAASAEAEEEDDDDCLIIPPSQVPAALKVAPHHRRKIWNQTNMEVDLLMECADDDLSPWQREANRQAEKEYHAAIEKIKHARAQAEATAKQQMAVQPLPSPPRIVTPPTTKSDVIVIDEEPLRGGVLGQKVSPRMMLSQTAFQGPVPGMQKMILTGPHGQSQILVPNNFSVISSGKPVAPPVAPGNDTQIVREPYKQPNFADMPIYGRVARQQKVHLRRKQQFVPGETEVVSGTSGLGIKRNSSEPLSQAAKKRAASISSVSAKKDESSWVPLDEYYYSKKEGDPTYREEKAEFRFKCWYCHKMLYNNLRIMMHMQGHIDSEKQQNLDLSDLTQCKHCYKQFDTPFEMQCHIERVHQNQSNVLVCRICEKDHDNQAALRQHMRNYHTTCEMPYICQLCNFRSSIYSDVVDHFKKRHDSSQYTLCLYCLRVFKINFSKLSGWGLTQNYYQHLQKHQVKNHSKKCPCCKLTFLNKGDVKMHKNKDHLPNYRGAGTISKAAPQTQETVMIQVPQETAKPKSGAPKSLNAPAVSKVRELRGIRLAISQSLSNLSCIECRSPMATTEHYKKYVECSMCRFATTCNIAYANHMMALHSGNHILEHMIVPREQRLAQRMFCRCGYSSVYGNKMASHLVFCSKRTTYFRKPETRWFEYDDEQEEFNPFEPYVEEPDVPEAESPKKKEEMTLLGVLGLVKKKADSPSPSPVDESSIDVAVKLIDTVLDTVFPAESAANEFIGQLLANTDTEIRARVAMKEVEQRVRKAEVTAAAVIAAAEAEGPHDDGVRWSPPKPQDGKSPMKMSIFSGGYKRKDKQRAEVPPVETLQQGVPGAMTEGSIESTSPEDSQDDTGSKDFCLSRNDSTSRENSVSGDGFTSCERRAAVATDRLGAVFPSHVTDLRAAPNLESSTGSMELTGVPLSEDSTGSTELRGVPEAEDSTGSTELEGVPEAEDSTGSTELRGVPEAEDSTGSTELEGVPEAEDSTGSTELRGVPEAEDSTGSTELRGVPEAEDSTGSTELEGVPEAEDSTGSTELRGVPEAEDFTGSTELRGAPQTEDSTENTELRGALQTKDSTDNTELRGAPECEEAMDTVPSEEEQASDVEMAAKTPEEEEEPMDEDPGSSQGSPEESQMDPVPCESTGQSTGPATSTKTEDTRIETMQQGLSTTSTDMKPEEPDKQNSKVSGDRGNDKTQTLEEKSCLVEEPSPETQPEDTVRNESKSEDPKFTIKSDVRSADTKSDVVMHQGKSEEKVETAKSKSLDATPPAKSPAAERRLPEQKAQGQSPSVTTVPSLKKVDGSRSSDKKPLNQSSEHQQSSKSYGSPSSSARRSSGHSHDQQRDDHRRDDYHRSDKGHDNRSRDYDNRHGYHDHQRSDDRYHRDDRHSGHDRYDYRGGHHYNRYDDHRGGHRERNHGRGGYDNHQDRHGYYGNRGGQRGGYGNRGGYYGGQY